MEYNTNSASQASSPDPDEVTEGTIPVASASDIITSEPFSIEYNLDALHQISR